MKIKLKISIFVSLFIGIFYAQIASADSSSQGCWNNATTQDAMDNCASQDYINSDQELNQIYHAIQVKYKDNPSFLAKLEIAEQAWIKFRDAQLAMMYPPEAALPGDDPNDDYLTYYGSVYPMCKSMYLTELTNDRIKQLKQWLDIPQNAYTCMGSIGSVTADS